MQKQNSRRTISGYRFPNSLANHTFSKSVCSEGTWHKLTTDLWRWIPSKPISPKLRGKVIYEPPMDSQTRIFEFNGEQGFVEATGIPVKRLFVEYTERGPTLFFANSGGVRELSMSDFPEDYFVVIDRQRAEAYVQRDKDLSKLNRVSQFLHVLHLVSFRNLSRKFVKVGKGLTDHPDALFLYPISSMYAIYPILRIEIQGMILTKVSYSEARNAKASGENTYHSAYPFEFSSVIRISAGISLTAKEYYILELPEGSKHQPKSDYSFLISMDRVIDIY